jgi:CPA2 family monovalent cation:H+ antiporter-2
LLATLAVTLGKVGVFVGLMLLVGTRVLPWLLDAVVRTGSRELFTLAVVVVARGIAFGAAELFGVSFALGAFFAGVVINESDHSHRAALTCRRYRMRSPCSSSWRWRTTPPR